MATANLACSAISFPWSQVIAASPANDLVKPITPVHLCELTEADSPTSRQARQHAQNRPVHRRRLGDSDAGRGRGTEHPAEQPERRTDNLPVQHQVSPRNSCSAIGMDLPGQGNSRCVIGPDFD